MPKRTISEKPNATKKNDDEMDDENSADKNDDRQMTSAINNMSVADVRKALSNMRKEWTKHSVVHPFFPSYHVTEELTISEFAFKFVMGHHAKRHAKFFLSNN
jgi:hypothetical protein